MDYLQVPTYIHAYIPYSHIHSYILTYILSRHCFVSTTPLGVFSRLFQILDTNNTGQMRYGNVHILVCSHTHVLTYSCIHTYKLFQPRGVSVRHLFVQKSAYHEQIETVFCIL